MVPGIDVSHYNGVIDWRKVAESGVKYAYIKCTDGPLWEDPMYATNASGARAFGLKIGSYHFLRSGFTADQIARFLRLVNSGEYPDDLPPCLDVELPGPLPVQECIGRIVSELNRVPVVYTNPSIGTTLSGTVGPSELWIAEYDVEAPQPPLLWGEWRFWQYTDKGIVLGIEGNVDLDWFNGDQEQFDLWLTQVKRLPI